MSDGNRPDGVTIIPWIRGKPLAWDITVADTYAISYVDNTATREAAPQTEQIQRRPPTTQSFPNPPLLCI